MFDVFFWICGDIGMFVWWFLFVFIDEWVLILVFVMWFDEEVMIVVGGLGMFFICVDKVMSDVLVVWIEGLYDVNLIVCFLCVVFWE